MFYDKDDDLEKNCNPTNLDASGSEDSLTGISGLLALLACMLFAGVCIEISSVLELFKLTTFNVFLFIAHSVGILVNVFLVVLLFKKVYFFPTVAFWCLLISGVISLVPAMILRADILTAVIVGKTAAWCMYLKMSERVHKTFVYTWNGKEVDKN